MSYPSLKRCQLFPKVDAFDPVVDTPLEDVSHKKWKDAFYGRYTELPDGSIERPFQRKSKQHDIELTAANVRPSDFSIDDTNQPRI